jgi:hypothetical protein
MFDSKKTQLFDRPTNTIGDIVLSKASGNAFLADAAKRSAETLSQNGSLKYSTTGSEFVDQFGRIGTYLAPRKFGHIASDMSKLYAINPLEAVQFILYTRMITRVTQLPEGGATSEVQRGAGLKHESIMRMIWLAKFHPEVFWKNLSLFIAAGSWKDIIVMLSTDLQFNGWDDRQLDWDKMGQVILSALENPQHSELIKKYLPQIKAKAKCKTLNSQADTMIGKWLCSQIFGSKGSKITGHYREYRMLKASGTAHQWQQLISEKSLLAIDFNTIHGRALALLVSGKFLQNNNLEKEFEAWIDSQPVVKFTGYPHELFQKYGKVQYNTLSLNGMRVPQIKAMNKQFDGLVEVAKKGASSGTSMIVVRDTSASMGSPATGSTMSAFDIAKALALFFSEMLPAGAFADSWIEFNSDAKLHQWKGANAYEKWINDKSSFIGSTNFQSVINLLCISKKRGITEDQFPTGILCISDGEFNPAELGRSNVDAARAKLRASGFSEDYVENFKIVLWNLRGNYYGGSQEINFETYGNVPNVFYFSGYDASIIAFLTGLDAKADQPAPQNAEELFKAAMDQEILGLVKI